MHQPHTRKGLNQGRGIKHKLEDQTQFCANDPSLPVCYKPFHMLETPHTQKKKKRSKPSLGCLILPIYRWPNTCFSHKTTLSECQSGSVSSCTITLNLRGPPAEWGPLDRLSRLYAYAGCRSRSRDWKFYYSSPSYRPCNSKERLPPSTKLSLPELISRNMNYTY